MKFRVSLVAVLFAALAMTTVAYAAKIVEEIEIEGMVSPASPKALSAALEDDGARETRADAREETRLERALRARFEPHHPEE